MIATLAGTAAALVGLITALLGFLFGRRRQNADTESVQVKSALELNASMERRIGALEAMTASQEKELDVLRRRERIQGRLLARHERWDIEVVHTLRAHDIPVDPPPSLDTADEPDPNGPRTRAEDYAGTRREADT